MTPSKKESGKTNPYRTQRGSDGPSGSLSLLQLKERNLPPLPVEADTPDAADPKCSRIPPSSLIPSESLGKPSKHAIVFPTSKPTFSRPKLQLETEWDKAFAAHAPSFSASDTPPCKLFARRRCRTVSNSSRECLLDPSSEDPSSSIRDRNTRSKTFPTPQHRSTNCRFLSAVSSVVTIAQSTTLTTRATHGHNLTMMPQPFIKSDGTSSEGITVTVQREQRVEGPIAMPTLASSSSSTSLLSHSSVGSNVSFPADMTKDLPAIPPADVDADDQSPPPHLSVLNNASKSESQLPAAALVSVVQMDRRPAGAKRRKHYKIRRVSPPLA